MRQRLSLVITAIVAAFVLQIVSVGAQKETGSISGTIHDPPGALVPAAHVILWPTDAPMQILMTTSDDEGQYSFKNLPAGSYDIRVEMPEFATETKMRLMVNESKITTVDFSLKFFAACSEFEERGEIGASDSAELVRLTLEDAIVKKRIPDYNLLTNGKRAIIISTKNIQAGWVPLLLGYKFTVLRPEEIQRRADIGHDFLHLAFDRFEIHGACVAVTLSNSWAVGKRSGMGYLSGGGSVYEFRKQDGKWVGKMVGGWIS